MLSGPALAQLCLETSSDAPGLGLRESGVEMPRFTKHFAGCGGFAEPDFAKQKTLVPASACGKLCCLECSFCVPCSTSPLDHRDPCGFPTSCSLQISLPRMPPSAHAWWRVTQGEQGRFP